MYPRTSGMCGFFDEHSFLGSSIPPKVVDCPVFPTNMIFLNVRVPPNFSNVPFFFDILLFLASSVPPSFRLSCFPEHHQRPKLHGPMSPIYTRIYGYNYPSVTLTGTFLPLGLGVLGVFSLTSVAYHP